jgi:hypothetical protein
LPESQNLEVSRRDTSTPCRHSSKVLKDHAIWSWATCAHRITVRDEVGNAPLECSKLDQLRAHGGKMVESQVAGFHAGPVMVLRQGNQ